MTIKKPEILGKPCLLVLDLDGVLTDGKIYQSENGKIFKVFGPDDHDAIQFSEKYLQIVVISADREGETISRSRVSKKLGLDFFIVGTTERIEWIKQKKQEFFTIYMGDGFYDSLVFSECDYSISPQNASIKTRQSANYVTSHCGGDRAVSEAILHILEKFFGVLLWT